MNMVELPGLAVFEKLQAGLLTRIHLPPKSLPGWRQWH